MKKLLHALMKRRFPYQPLITVELSRSRLIHNLNEFRKIAPNQSVAPVLKSNAYGHGLMEVAGILERESGIPFFVIDSYFEAISLRSAGIHTPLLIIGYSRPEMILNSRLKNVAFTITNLDTLKDLKEARHSLHIHIKIDTGMHRQGILPSETSEAIKLVKENPQIILEGICSHLSDADSADDTFSKKQVAEWNGIAKTFKSDFPSMKYIHLSNTDGHRFTDTVKANVSRLGIGLYGLADGGSYKEKGFEALDSVLELKTILTSIKNIHAGDTVGYSNTFKASDDMTIATIPIGYFEGINRKLSNNGVVLVGPQRIACPIVGRVSMNITTIDVSKVTDAHIGMEAVAISAHSSDTNSIVSIAKMCGTISYEIAVHIPQHLKRIVVA